MKFKTPKLLLVAIVSFALPLTVSAEAFGGSGSCSGSGCTGVDIGGGGTGFTGGEGSGGYLSDNNWVRWDGFRADPTRFSDRSCVQDDRDRRIMGRLGYPPNYSGDLYYSRRVAVQRETLEVIGGVPGSKYWDLWWNADSGATRTTPPPSDPGGNGPVWFEPNWVQPGSNGDYCLPLNGGSQVSAALEAAAPKVLINGKEYLPTDNPKVVTGMKNATIRVQVPEDKLQGLIAINFDLTSLWIRVTKPDPDFPDDITKDDFVYDNFFAIIANKRGSGVELKPVVFDLNTGTAEYKLKFKKKGTYRIQVIAGFGAQVLANGVQVYAGGVSTSTDTILTVKSAKSVNRKS